MNDSPLTAEWLELSGLPAELEKTRAGAWAVFKKIVELDCRRNRDPDLVEISLGELAERLGTKWEKVARCLEALVKKKRLAAFLPDNPDETGVFRVRLPVETPIPPEEVALKATDPFLRDARTFRYVRPQERSDALDEKMKEVVDLYLDVLSQKLHSHIVDQLETLAARFPLEKIRLMMERGARIDVRSITWVARELVRDEAKARELERKRAADREHEEARAASS